MSRSFASMRRRGAVVLRRELHDLVGGQRQGGISTPTCVPYVFLFKSAAGSENGYRDGFAPSGHFLYTGEGQRGDMTLERGNAAIRWHQSNHKRILVFQSLGDGRVRSLGRATYVGHSVATLKDRRGRARKAIMFTLKLRGVPILAESD